MNYTKHILDRTFYREPTSIVAQNLLGTYLVRRFHTNLLVGKIIETEAYLPFVDPASHGYKGRTKRNEVLFGPAGYTYVHTIHTHHCIDIVTDDINTAGSVLIRAVEPVEGIEIMKQFRLFTGIQNLTNGPGKLCQAFHITREDNGKDVTRPDSDIVISGIHATLQHLSIHKSPRIGISKGKELLLRFTLK